MWNVSFSFFVFPSYLMRGSWALSQCEECKLQIQEACGGGEIPKETHNLALV